MVGVTYGLYGLGLLLMWPALIGVIIAYVKRHDVPELLASHYRWLISTFWWWLIAWNVMIGAMIAVLIPNAIDIKSAVESGQYFNIPWELIGAVRAGRFGFGDRLAMGRVSVDPWRDSFVRRPGGAVTR